MQFRFRNHTTSETLYYLVRMFRCFGPDDLARRAGLYHFAGRRLPTPNVDVSAICQQKEKNSSVI